MSLPAHQSAAPGDPSQRTVADTSRASGDRARALCDLAPFAVEVRRRENFTIVRPRGELDLVSAETLRSTLDAAIAESLSAALDRAELVLDLRGLTFIDSTGLHLLVALDRRARREGFRLALVAPDAPIDRPIRLCGLDKTLAFAPPVDAVKTEAGECGQPVVASRVGDGVTRD